MADYILIESRDPFDSAEVGRFLDLAEGLAKEGGDVALFLVQNAVLQARAKAAGSRLGRMRAAGIDVYADEFSLRERGIQDAAPHAVRAPIRLVIDRMCAGWSHVWH